MRRFRRRPFQILVAAFLSTAIALAVEPPVLAATSGTGVVSSTQWKGGPGVTVCYPKTYSSTSPCKDSVTGVKVPPRAPTTNYECIELALRYWQDSGWFQGDFGVGSAKDIWKVWSVTSAGLAAAQRHPKGDKPDTYVPGHGDLIVHDSGVGNGNGHVAVVDWVKPTSSGYTINAVEENWSSTGRSTYTEDVLGAISRPGGDVASDILGVLRA